MQVFVVALLCVIDVSLLLFQSICKPAPFSDESDAVGERERCDYQIKITVAMARAGNGEN
jgi:choline-phosphate cytidylyltransferase